MSDASFFRALLPDRFRILGLRLKTFSLGHFYLLQAIDSPYLFKDQEKTIEDLAAGVFICSRNWKSNLWHLNHQRLHLLYELIWQRCIGLFNFTEKTALFNDYLSEELQWPIVKERHGVDGYPQTDKTGAPLSLDVRTFLLANFRFDPDALWDRPWSQCMLDYLSLKSIRGEIEFVDRDAFEAAKEAGLKVAELIKSGKLKIPKK